MTKPMLLDDFVRLPRSVRASLVDGLSTAIDRVAEASPQSHRFLRYQWYAAALAAYGGHARTLIVSAEETPALTLPLAGFGPAWLGMAAIPGSYWPFRGFGMIEGVGREVVDAALDMLAGAVNLLRIGPVHDGDPAVAPLVEAARERGWGVIERVVARSHLLDMAAAQRAGPWPRNSTLRKNRFHEKHLAEHGEIDWRFVSGDDWPAAFDALGAIEQASWIAARTDGSDAKFTASGHGAFWRAAATDPVLAAMLRAALLTIDGKPAAFSFDVDAGDLKYAVANSYDPAFAKHSPGKLLYYRNLVDSLSRGITRVDWGAGDSGYKQTIGAQEGPLLRDWLLLRPGLPAALRGLVRLVWRSTEPD